MKPVPRVAKLVAGVVSIAVAGCANFTQRALRPSLIELCPLAPSYDLSTRLAAIRQAYIIRNDFAVAESTMLAIARDFGCAPGVVVFMTYAYAGETEGPLAGSGTSCISHAIVEKWYTQPHFEEWAACDQPASPTYLIDFNNIVTRNRPTDASLRFEGVETVGTRFNKNFFGRLQQRLVVRDYAEFMSEAVLFEIDSQRDVQFELNVALEN